jgi:hypothetical protein
MAGQVVQITINVTNGNAAEAVQQVVAQLNAIGPAGESAGAQAGAGLDQVGEHALSSRENVRLLSEELGMRVPRAMQSVIANSQMMMGAINMIGPAMIAMGGATILFDLGEKAYGAYEKYVLLKDVIAESDAVIKGFGDDAAAAMDKAAEAHERYLRITQGAQAADQFSLDRYKNTAIPIPQYQSDDFKKLPDEVKGKFEAITGESVMPKDLDATISKLKDYEAQQAKILAYWKQTVADPSQSQESSMAISGMTGAIPQQQMRVDAGAQLLADLKAQQDNYQQHVLGSQAQIDADAKEKAAQAVAKEKEKQDAIIQLQNSAVNSGLQGIALLENQREQALDSFKSKYGASRAAIDAIDTDYNNKETALWSQQWQEANKVMRTAQQAAQQAAHTGAGSIENQRQDTYADIDQKLKTGFDPDAANQMKMAADSKANTDILAAQREFEQQMQEIGTHADDTQITGYARIADEAEKSLKQIQGDWQSYADKVGATSLEAKEAQERVNSEILKVNQDTLREMAQLHTKTMQQIDKEEEQAARLTLPEWQQSELAIQDAFEDRVRAYQEAEDQQLAATKGNANAQFLIVQTYNQQVAAADAVMQAQLQKNSEETRDKLASGLQSLFTHPEQFFEKRAMDTAFQMMANQMLSAFKSDSPTGGMLQYLFGMGPQMSTSTNPLTDLQSALGIGGHGASSLTSSTINPAMVQFQQGSTTLLTGSQALMSAASTLQSAAGTMAASGGTSMGSGGFSMLGSTSGSTFGGAGASGMAGASSVGMPETESPDMSGTLLPNGAFVNSSGSMPETSSDALAGSLNADGSFTSAGGGQGFGAAAGIAGGAVMGISSIYSAYENSNPTAGMVGGAMGGMEMGAAIGSIIPGLGTLAGAAIGAVAGGITGLLAGIFGDQGRGQAESLDVNTIQPALLKDMQDYEAGRSGYNSLASDLGGMLTSAKNSTSSMGSGARNYYNSNIAPEINAAISTLQKQERGGRSQVTMTAGQYHTGGFVGGFGDLATSDTEGFIHAMQNEFVVQPAAAQAHAPLLSAINAGNVSYASTVQPRMPASSATGPAIQLTVQAIDSKSVATWAKGGGGRALVAAYNQAQRQYSGVGRG